MRLIISDRHNDLTEATRALLTRRLHFVLSRFSPRIRQVSVFIGDQNGPKGGIDTSCRILAKLDRLGEIVVSSEHSELLNCVTHAVDRLGRAVARTIERSQEHNRRQPFSLS